MTFEIVIIGMQPLRFMMPFSCLCDADISSALAIAANDAYPCIDWSDYDTPVLGLYAVLNGSTSVTIYHGSEGPRDWEWSANRPLVFTEVNTFVALKTDMDRKAIIDKLSSQVRDFEEEIANLRSRITASMANIAAKDSNIKLLTLEVDTLRRARP